MKKFKVGMSQRWWNEVEVEAEDWAEARQIVYDMWEDNCANPIFLDGLLDDFQVEDAEEIENENILS